MPSKHDIFALLDELKDAITADEITSLFIMSRERRTGDWLEYYAVHDVDDLMLELYSARMRVMREQLIYKTH